MSKCELSVPPKSPVVGAIWVREDGVVFHWTQAGWTKGA